MRTVLYLTARILPVSAHPTRCGQRTAFVRKFETVVNKLEACGGVADLTMPRRLCVDRAGRYAIPLLQQGSMPALLNRHQSHADCTWPKPRRAAAARLHRARPRAMTSSTISVTAKTIARRCSLSSTFWHCVHTAADLVDDLWKSARTTAHTRLEFFNHLRSTLSLSFSPPGMTCSKLVRSKRRRPEPNSKMRTAACYLQFSQWLLRG